MELIKFWRELDIKQKTFEHLDDDIDLNKKYKNIYCYDDYIKNNLESRGNKSKGEESKFHLNLIPIPYIGNIKEAKIYILMLNPGFRILDYYAESNDKELKKSLINNLRQENFDPEYPFIFLNPKFLWHGGGQYYENRFKELIKEAKGEQYSQKLSRVAKKVAVLQLVPYHSKADPKMKHLESSRKIKNFVKNELLAKAGNEICIISVRSRKCWGLDGGVIYSDQPTRSAHISKNNFKNPHWNTIIAKLNES